MGQWGIKAMGQTPTFDIMSGHSRALSAGLTAEPGPTKTAGEASGRNLGEPGGDGGWGGVFDWVGKEGHPRWKLRRVRRREEREGIQRGNRIPLEPWSAGV